jgi:hypothetical protein
MLSRIRRNSAALRRATSIAKLMLNLYRFNTFAQRRVFAFLKTIIVFVCLTDRPKAKSGGQTASCAAGAIAHDVLAS